MPWPPRTNRGPNGHHQLFANLLRDPRGFIASWIAMGPAFAYGFVLLIIFVETGVVFFSFPPGDSPLFAVGLGDQCNFMIGYFFGGILFVRQRFELLIIGIVAASPIPAVVGLVRFQLNKKKDKAQ